jgi:hypothetical protein
MRESRAGIHGLGFMLTSSPGGRSERLSRNVRRATTRSEEEYNANKRKPSITVAELPTGVVTVTKTYTGADHAGHG